MCELQECWADRNNALRGTVAILAPDEVVLVAEALDSLSANESGGARCKATSLAR